MARFSPLRTRRRPNLLPLTAALLWASLSGDGWAQAPGAAQVGASGSAVLLEQAAFWQQQGQPERALQALTRLLGSEPNNLEALAIAAELAAVTDNAPQAQQYLTRLRRAAPEDPRLQRLTELARLLQDDQASLTRARQQAAAGRPLEALRLYQQLFRNNVIPSVIAREYYQVLAGSSESGYRDAVRQLERMTAAAPSDARLALVYAQILTYREENRDTGIELLQQLSRQSATREGARLAWRQALLWGGDAPETAALIEQYLTVHPRDPELERKLAASEQQDTFFSPSVQVRTFGWAAMTRRNIAEAERRFLEAITLDPNDFEAMMGMAAVRGAQDRRDEARRYFAQATAIAPDRAAEFAGLVDFGPQATWVAGRAGVGSGGGGPLAPAWSALARGDLETADRLARRYSTARGSDRIDVEMILGQVASQRQDFVAAEARFRNALALRPRLPAALNGLYFALMGQGRLAEADALQRDSGFAVPQGAAAARAEVLRRLSALADSPPQAMSLLRLALATDPSNPWIRAEFARRLTLAGEAAEAQDIQRRLEGEAGAEAATAAALLAIDQERYGSALAQLERIPARVRSADTNRLLPVVRREHEVRQLEFAIRERRPGAVEALLAKSQQRDPSFYIGPSVVRAFARLGQSHNAGLAARNALAANPGTSANDRIALASALLEAERLEDASALTRPLLNDRSLPAETQRQLLAVVEAGAGQQSDTLATRASPGAAYQVLAPALRAAPTSVPLNLALVRLYLASNRTDEARELAEAVLALDPRNVNARIGLIDVEIAANRLQRARALATETAFLFPGDPQVVMAEARVARASGDQVRALRLMESVASRRIEHLRSSGQVAESGVVAQAFRPGSPPTVVRSVTDPVSRRIAEQLVQARDEAAIWLQAGANVQTRPGTSGTTQLLTLSSPSQVSAPVPRLGGRIILGVDTVALDAGSASTNFNEARQFGANPLLQQENFRRPVTRAEGVALRLTYLMPSIRADVASSPLGFARQTVLGGLEVAPRINEQLRLRLLFERRTVNDSLLSFAGQAAGGGLAAWGGVVRTGGRIQLEWAPADRFGFYAGAGAATLQGKNVATNSLIEATVGTYYSLLRDENQSLTLGMNVNYLSFERNLSGFTFGNGGYFSPQQSLVASLQAEYQVHHGPWSARLAGTAGYQAFRTSSAPIFPTNSAMQSQLTAAAAGDPSLAVQNASQRSSGLTGSASANVEYAISPQVRLGLAGSYTQVGDFQDIGGMFYLRWRLDAPRRDLLPFYEGTPGPRPGNNYPIASSFATGRPEWVQLIPGTIRPVW